MQKHSRDEHGRLVDPSRPQRMSYWLLPGSEHLSALGSLVATLAEKHAGPLFDPHVTIYSGPYDVADSPADLIRQATHGTQPLTLTSTGLGFSDEFTKSCYIQFDPNETLQAMTESFRSGCSIPSDYSLDPHMSLFYGSLDSTAREKIRTLVDIPVELQFTAVWAVSNPSSAKRKQDVESWRLAHIEELR